MAISNPDGSIILTTKVDDSGLKNGTRNLKSEAAKLAAEYRKAGMSQSEAFKKAWSEIDRTEKKTRQYNKTAKATGQTSSKAFATIATAIAAMAAAVIVELKQVMSAIISFSKEAADLATETEASTLRLIDIYGQAASALGDFIDANARALGMSKAAAASFSAVYGNLFSTWADQATNAELTANYLNMTAVVASKTGRTMADVQERIRSGLLGNTEAVEDLGIFVNVKTVEMTKAFQKLAGDKSWEQLGAAQQNQIRTLAILEQATEKYGSEVADTASLTKAQYTAAYEDFKNTWGKIVNVVLVPALRVATDVLNTLTLVMQLFASMSGKTVEDTTAALNGAIDKQEALTEEVGETEKALKKATAGFDELNILSSGSTKTTGTASEGTAAPVIPIETMGEIVNLEFNLTSNIAEFADDINLNKEKILEIISPLKTEFVTLGENIRTAWGGIYTNILVPFGNWFVEDFSPEYISSVAEDVETLNGKVEKLGETLSDVSEEDLEPIFEKMGNLVTTVSDSISTITDDTLTTFEKYGDGLGTVLNLALGFVTDIISTFSIGVSMTLGLFADLVTHGGKFTESILSSAGEFISAIFALAEGDTDSFELHVERFVLSVGNFVFSIMNILIGALNTLWKYALECIALFWNPIATVIEDVGRLTGQDWTLSRLNASNIPTIGYLDYFELPELPDIATGKRVPYDSSYEGMRSELIAMKNGEANSYGLGYEELREEISAMRNDVHEAILEVDGERFGKVVFNSYNKTKKRVGVNFSEG